MRRPHIDQKVERVVLDAMAKGTAALPPNICAHRIDLTSVRAGLAFSGEVDPPFTHDGTILTRGTDF